MKCSIIVKFYFPGRINFDGSTTNLQNPKKSLAPRHYTQPPCYYNVSLAMSPAPLILVGAAAAENTMRPQSADCISSYLSSELSLGIFGCSQVLSQLFVLHSILYIPQTKQV